MGVVRSLLGEIRGIRVGVVRSCNSEVLIELKLYLEVGSIELRAVRNLVEELRGIQ